MKVRLGGDGALVLAAVFLGLNYVAIKVAVVSVNTGCRYQATGIRKIS